MRHVVSLVGALCVISVARVAAAQQVVLSMTPEKIDEAIRVAADEKAAARFLDAYLLQNRTGFGNGPPIGVFSTPFSRVVQAAVAARKQGKSLAATDVSPDLIAPELHIVASSQRAASDDTLVNVSSVTLAPRGSKDGREVLQPVKTSDLSPEYQDLHGTAFTAAGVVATFPLAGLTPNLDVHVVFDRYCSRFVGGVAVPRVHRPFDLGSRPVGSAAASRESRRHCPRQTRKPASGARDGNDGARTSQGLFAANAETESAFQNVARTFRLR